MQKVHRHRGNSTPLPASRVLPGTSDAPPPQEVERVEVCRFVKSKTEQVIGTFHRFRGDAFFDLRAYFQDPATGRDVPTKKGLCVSVEQLPDLLEAVKKAIGARPARRVG